ncbi:MAG: ABC transporter ATP-binding protein [Pseudochelatococcus sp.]|jgi:putative spermidine/putrescine transport system ATP-binding protein|uniref:ABC transporter ATP-binding protein n=1 Tax=Pseudochelatococcus sp. TaxID=2020869 RepID=UPI003D8D2E62
MSSIEIANINKFYGTTQALFDVSLSINKGEFVTLLGPSGSGKTTLLKILSGFEPVSSGTITMDGRNITSVRPEKRNFGLVFQGYALFPHMSVHDNIAYPLKVRRFRRDEIETRVNAMLDLVQLGRFANRKPSEMSGGQQQRVALARALVFKPDLLLLDEPMSALDKKLRVDLQEELRDIHRTLGTTFINVTHDQEEAMHMSDRIAVMNHGRIEQYDSAFNLYRHPTSRFVADFIGKSNLFPGEVLRDGAEHVFRSDSMSVRVAEAPARTGKATLLIRPEDATLEPAPPGDGRLHLAANVLHSTYSGDRALYTVTLGDGAPFIAYGRARSGIYEDGESVYVTFKAEDCMVLPDAA